MDKIDPKEQFNYNRSPANARGYPNLSGAIDRGYAVNPGYGVDKSGFFNGMLAFEEPGQNGQIAKVGLFVNDVKFGMSLSGEAAQSQGVNQFFAHNINTPEIMVTCQARSSFEYSYIAEFIRMTQIYLTQNFKAGNEYHGLVRFYLDAFTHEDSTKNSFKNKNTKQVYVIQDHPPRSPSDDRNTHYYASSGNHMGGHGQIDVQCYITSVTRMAEVGTQMYEFQFGLELYDSKENEGGLPFTSLIQDGNMEGTDGIQWDYEELSVNSGDFVKASNISISELPHQGKKTTNQQVTPPTAPPKTSPSSGGDVTGSIISSIGSQIGSGL